ncbi:MULTISPECIES: LysR family transcriptional regulator [Paenibacillus]|uniref:LysR family transcriptional regulator n=2 Tax=Paenibacillus TaxID=44249 RepID=A0ABX2ZI17_PAEPO|nr:MULTISPECIES: LysR family transcriptional regulator [Paenibacillus]APB78073.1 LysR family transcriptional regulator [Paenibacillus polymyxa]MDR6780468.1 DNA-binding transcriptional LysR family regulator [Paenibacillus peoriae]ODA11428.1 LysR family transcriptional regulator [Paenibacillus polymyxa]OME68297.1 LysR family transcriptional regulator [Paenibacillus peoriae]POR26917.1 LysR family transcriptional regulator [Paenibacillus polymyxa]
MESSDLKIFRAVAREGSITKAAQALNYVQSNVTSRIQQLEAQLKVPLFRRSNRGMALTPAGENLLEYADTILTLLDEAEKSTQYSDQPAGPLRLGSIETAAVTHLTSLLTEYHAQYPDVHLSLMTGSTHDLVQKVLNYELDGAFVYGPVDDPHIEYVAAFEEELVLISEPGKKDMDELLAKPMLFFDVGCTHRTRAESFLSEAGVAAYQVMEFGTLEVILGGVASGLGVSMLPQSSIAKAEGAGSIVSHRLPKKYRKLEVWFVHRRDSVYSSALSGLLHWMKKDAILNRD